MDIFNDLNSVTVIGSCKISAIELAHRTFQASSFHGKCISFRDILHKTVGVHFKLFFHCLLHPVNICYHECIFFRSNPYFVYLFRKQALVLKRSLRERERGRDITCNIYSHVSFCLIELLYLVSIKAFRKTSSTVDLDPFLSCCQLKVVVILVPYWCKSLRFFGLHALAALKM